MSAPRTRIRLVQPLDEDDLRDLAPGVDLRERVDAVTDGARHGHRAARVGVAPQAAAGQRELHVGRGPPRPRARQRARRRRQRRAARLPVEGGQRRRRPRRVDRLLEGDPRLHVDRHLGLVARPRAAAEAHRRRAPARRQRASRSRSARRARRRRRCRRERRRRRLRWAAAPRLHGAVGPLPDAAVQIVHAEAALAGGVARRRAPRRLPPATPVPQTRACSRRRTRRRGCRAPCRRAPARARCRGACPCACAEPRGLVARHVGRRDRADLVRVREGRRCRSRASTTCSPAISSSATRGSSSGGVPR